MRWLGLLLLLPLASALLPLGCGTDAVGIEDCRSIERARCQAGQHCSFGIDSTSEEQVCERFARDNCLHGLVVQASTTGAVTNCVNSINAAGACAAKKTSLNDCTAIGEVTKASATICDLIQNPEQISSCEFLTQTPPPPATATSAPKDSGKD
jgi:hypothetical protein